MAKDIAFSNDHFIAARSKSEPKASLFERSASWFAALRLARHEREIERYINDHGGVLTDSLEREIGHRFGNTDPGRH